MMYLRGMGDEYVLNGEVRIVRAGNGPCIVCGHPTGDCSGDLPAPTALAGTHAYPSLGHGEIFVVADDVWEKRQITPFTEATVLVARKGAAIPMAKARDLGLT
jgi:hypothetical protein